MTQTTDEPFDHNVCQRLLTIVADAAREDEPLSHAAVERAMGMLTGIYASPRTLCATPDGTLIARWDHGLVLEIGPDWERRLK
jgi:hypothetical protein